MHAIASKSYAFRGY